MKRFRDALKVSLLAVFAAWMVGIVCMAIPYAYPLVFHAEAYRFDWIALMVIFLMPLPVLPVVWLLALLPYAWLTPHGSFLWKRSVLAGIGFLAGSLIVVIGSFLEFKLGLYHGNNAVDPWGPLLNRDLHNWGLTSAIVGATAGLVSALVHRQLGKCDRLV